MNSFPYAPLVEVTRGALVESVHLGALAVVDSHGRLLFSLGDPQLVTFLRSSSKPFQVLPLIESGAEQAFDLQDHEIAIMCASHSGTDEHLQVIQSLQARIGLAESDLICGTHPPLHAPTAEAMRLRGEAPGPNRHNCSGKHTGFLAYSLLHGLPKKDYIDPQKPLQQKVLQAFAEMIDYPREKIAIGIDGCSAPVFAAPLYHAAYGFARLADPHALAPERAAACRRVTGAMMAAPFMVAGPERFDSMVMIAADGKVIAKTGAEGYQGIAIMPGSLDKDSPGIGIAYKVIDGDLPGRARPVIGVEILRSLGVLSQEKIQQHLAALASRPVTNWRGIEVGEMRPAFSLEYQH